MLVPLLCQFNSMCTILSYQCCKTDFILTARPLEGHICGKLVQLALFTGKHNLWLMFSSAHKSFKVCAFENVRFGYVWVGYVLLGTPQIKNVFQSLNGVHFNIVTFDLVILSVQGMSSQETLAHVMSKNKK